MRLNDLDKQNYASKALKENFEMNFDVSVMDKSKTKTMLNKVNNLIKESRSAPDFYRNQTNPAYMKLVFMEQALSSHYAQLQARPSPRIVFENEEVENLKKQNAEYKKALVSVSYTHLTLPTKRIV